MLCVWSKGTPAKVLGNLSPVLRPVPQVPVSVVNDYSVPTGTTAILALGGDALKRLQDEKILPKNRTTTSYRTRPLNRAGIPVLVSYSPDIGEIDHGYYVDLLTDVTLALRYCLTGKWVPQYGEYRYVPDFTKLIETITARATFTEKPVDVAADSETLGLDPYALPTLVPPFPGAYIVSIQATCDKGKADVVRFGNRLHEEDRLHDPAFREQLEFLLNSPLIRLRMANGKYDMHWFWRRAKLQSKSFVFDTTIVGSLLDENRSNSLNTHTKIYVPRLAGYDDEFERTVDKNRMDKVPPEQLLPYAGGDVDADLEVAEVMKQELLKDPDLTAFYVNILHPASRAFEQIEQGGIFVDMDAFNALKTELEQEHVRLVKEACQIMGGRIVAKHGDRSKPGGMNLTKKSMLCDFLFSPMGLNLKPTAFTPKPDKDGIQRPATGIEELAAYKDHPTAKAFIEIIEQDSGITKTLNTFVVGFLKHLRSDGKFHPTFFLYVGDRDDADEGGANTGRLSCKRPPFQVIPKHTKWAKKIRRCYPAPPGYVVVERDYSQGELRVAACIAHEANMIAAYKAGRDLHLETAAPFAGHTYESLLALKFEDAYRFAETRQLGKAGNFGLLFGMGVEGFMEYARANYGVLLTYEEAKAFRTGFFQRYPNLLVYHSQYKQFARDHGHVRTPLGRVRHLPLIKSPRQELAAKAERQAINSPVQGTLTDMLLWTLALEWQQGLADVAPCFGSCHDSAYNYCPEDQLFTVLPQQLEIMQNLPFHKVGWEPQLQFLADAKYGPTMADMTEFQ